MAYLQESDYTLRISNDVLTEILDQAAYTSGLSGQEVRGNAERWAQSVIYSFLGARYQINSEFGRIAPDASRNFLILGIMLDLSIWTLHKTVNPRDIPELRQKCYEDAMLWLAQARDGEFLINGVSVISQYNTAQIGSQVKFVSNEFKDARQFDDYTNNFPYPNSPIPL